MTFTTHTPTPRGIRSGVTITHDNTYDGVQPAHGLVLEAYRAFFEWKSQSLPWEWDGATGDNPWDINDTEGNGTQHLGPQPIHVRKRNSFQRLGYYTG